MRDFVKRYINQLNTKACTSKESLKNVRSIQENESDQSQDR